MNNLLRNVESLDSTIRELEKNNSKLENGHFIFAHNTNDALIDKLKLARTSSISKSQSESDPNLLDDIGFLDKIIRELEKINSKIENGNIVFAWRDNRRVLAELQSVKRTVLLNSQESITCEK